MCTVLMVLVFASDMPRAASVPVMPRETVKAKRLVC